MFLATSCQYHKFLYVLLEWIYYPIMVRSSRYYKMIPINEHLSLASFSSIEFVLKYSSYSGPIAFSTKYGYLLVFIICVSFSCLAFLNASIVYCFCLLLICSLNSSEKGLLSLCYPFCYISLLDNFIS